MKFWVATADDHKLYDGTYTVLDNGVLVIHPRMSFTPLRGCLRCSGGRLMKFARNLTWPPAAEDQ
jgi:hypothetical protein